MRKEIIKNLYMYKKELLILKNQNIKTKKEEKVLKLVLVP